MAFPIALASSLIPLVADALPPMVRFLVGDKAADSVQKTTEAAETIAGTVSAVVGMKVETPAQVEEARVLLKENPDLMVKLRSQLAQVDADLARIELERERAYLNDVQDARRSQEKRGEFRGNLMLMSAYAAVILIVAMLIFLPADMQNQTVTGFVIGIGGMFARNIGSAFDFEFGSSRGSKNKEAQLGTELRQAQQVMADQAASQRKAEATKTVIRAAASAVDKLKDQLSKS